ncbi:hypothetical protein [Mucilaginibacter myungsuensis]|uniref:Uncharacterized protein n=1 Tax=Mucilaginibacter myungsuensis TaxID=649104 RepID=A0A929PYW8_9SPHI|nr:hypothetical protein [Mucilaginibacter myungsuensis]MBE9663772.1 hypothetical protein [Mucilaginibacter myungsuensis]
MCYIIVHLLIAAEAITFSLDRKSNKKIKRERSFSPPSFGNFSAERVAKGFPANAGPLFSQPHALLETWTMAIHLLRQRFGFG